MFKKQAVQVQNLKGGGKGKERKKNKEQTPPNL